MESMSMESMSMESMSGMGSPTSTMAMAMGSISSSVVASLMTMGSATASASMDMDMGSASATSAMVMSSGTAMHHGGMSNSSSDSMDGMSNSSSDSMSGMSNSSSDSMSGMSMHMNYYLTRKFEHYPVVFEKLYATHKRQAFGIFVLILAASFVYKFLLFVNWCLEVHWFKKWDTSMKSENLRSIVAGKGAAVGMTEVSETDSSKSKESYVDSNGLQMGSPLPQLPNLMFDIFAPNFIDLFHDSIRLLLIFTSTMIIYMLMLAAMSFVLTYVFAVIVGLTVSEVFFNRCKMALLKRWDIQRELDKINRCPGGAACRCGRHRQTAAGGEQCGCAAVDNNLERKIERDMSENAKLQEQGNDMDANLMPAEKFQ
ncbi:high-affinity Cu transporter CTR1 KNAG_0A07730 [Huiozyma naganishii CBS 8797]|uniref:Copper transport protein n=1 Tax=Huiozyma naganishii (strain ATCC MYA-139 / BCRC 22969 / CBS 8797 / KCTC 17520 / NBRC 10181 / NCYC 3082 / Yp74L-3) TaxID=1071383 RepID=J7R0T8_HUIN7|nr:hypothetical protein KNAG_0A07730 [Kazachstania naganishii CBS 8797]CCK68425.1 hypothetical protein KNAG_0A07730 [Kazachstania naganishii CBS 8797]